MDSINLKKFSNKIYEANNSIWRFAVKLFNSETMEAGSQ